MTDTNDLDVAHELGTLSGRVEALIDQVSTSHIETRGYIKDVDARLSALSEVNASALRAHMEREEVRLKNIEEKLSLGRFIWLTMKLLVALVAILIGLKTGSFADAVRHWKELI